jgi:hypothetical protein
MGNSSFLSESVSEDPPSTDPLDGRVPLFAGWPIPYGKPLFASLLPSLTKTTESCFGYAVFYQKTDFPTPAAGGVKSSAG